MLTSYLTLHRTLSTKLEINSGAVSQGHLIPNKVIGNRMHGYSRIRCIWSEKSYPRWIRTYDITIEDLPWCINTLFALRPLSRFLSDRKMEPKLKMKRGTSLIQLNNCGGSMLKRVERHEQTKGS